MTDMQLKDQLVEIRYLMAEGKTAQAVQMMDHVIGIGEERPDRDYQQIERMTLDIIYDRWYGHYPPRSGLLIETPGEA